MINKINKIIFKYLDDMNYNIIDGDNKLYFTDSKDSKYIHIRYDKDDGLCFIYHKLIKEISSFFSLGNSDAEKVIGEWVDNKLQMRVTMVRMNSWQKWELIDNTLLMNVTNALLDLSKIQNHVGNTSQMRVTNTVRV